MAVRYSVVDVDDVDPEGPSGAVRFLRRAVGATAFGFNWFGRGRSRTPRVGRSSA